MKKKPAQHDSAYKQFFSNPEMVESLLRDFVPIDFVKELDFSTLERYPESYITDDLRARHDDIIWRVKHQNGSPCYIVLLLEFQSHIDFWMALRILSYTALLLLDLIKTKQIKKKEKLPAVFPIVIYNGIKAWKAPLKVEELFSTMPESLKVYCPQQRYFLLDEGQISENDLEKSQGLVKELVKLERAEDLDAVREIIQELITRLKAPKYTNLRRMFTVWLGRVILKRSGITEEVPEFHDLNEVNAMLEERVLHWKDKYIQEGVSLGVQMGREEGFSLGKTEGIFLGRSEGMKLTLQDVLTERFGALPFTVVAYIEKISDFTLLRKLSLLAYQVPSLEVFVKEMETLQKEGLN